jgi:murein DD-endopeptidase MepM/ murein hydrolase activator NlpD
MGSDGVLALKSGGALGVTAGGTLTLAGSKIQQNNGAGPSPAKATEAQATTPTELSDRELNVESNYPEIQTRTIVSRLVTHEPFELHPGTNSGPDNQPVDLSSSSRVQVDGNATPSTNPNDIKPGESEKIKTDNSPWITPVTGTVSSLFGPRIPPTSGASSIHGGVDIANKMGTPVVAAKAGRVIKAGVGNGYGNVVYLDHGGGVTSRYAHLSAFKTSVGQQVTQGQVIGLVGNTGVGTGPHLHFEIRNGGVKTNPGSVLPGIVKGSRVVAGKGKA